MVKVYYDLLEVKADEAMIKDTCYDLMKNLDHDCDGKISLQEWMVLKLKWSSHDAATNKRFISSTKELKQHQPYTTAYSLYNVMSTHKHTHSCTPSFMHMNWYLCTDICALVSVHKPVHWNLCMQYSTWTAARELIIVIITLYFTLIKLSLNHCIGNYLLFAKLNIIN